MSAKLFTSLNNNKKMHTEGKNPEGKTLTKLEGMVASTANPEIKCEMTGEKKVNKKNRTSQDG